MPLGSLMMLPLVLVQPLSSASARKTFARVLTTIRSESSIEICHSKNCLPAGEADRHASRTAGRRETQQWRCALRS